MSHRLLKSESGLTLLVLLAAICLPAAAWAQAPASFPAPVLLPEDSSNDPTGSAGAPYDLTPFEADMVLAFDDNGIARPEWPRPPAHDDTPCNVAAGNEASLNACLDIPGKHIIIPAGDYAGPFTFDRSDQWIDMDNGATLRGGITIAGGANRVKITGGNFIGGSVFNVGVNDLLIDNVNMLLKDSGNPANERGSFQTCLTGTSCARMAIINSTCHATISCLFSANTPMGAATSLIVANYDAWSEFTPEGTGNDEYVSRLQNTDRVMLIDSHFRVYPTAKPPQRFHYGSTATLVANNIFEGSGTGFTNLWIDTTAGGPEQNDIDNMFILRNDFYQHDSTKVGDVNIDDSVAGNGIDVVLVHLEDNVSHHVNTANFRIAGNWNGIGQDCGGRAPCLRNINNTGVIVPGLTLIPFTAGADHSTQPAPTPADPPATAGPPPPPSPPTGGACSVQPNLNPGNILGGPFLDCGYSDSTRVPNPTRMQYALQSMSQQTTCITPEFAPAAWAFPNLPEIEISSSDQEYHNSGTFPGNVIFTGQRVKFVNTQSGRVLGNPVCGPGARHIEYDGACICP